MMTIDMDRLTNHGETRNLVGRPQGEEARRTLGLDEADARGEPVSVEIPDYVSAISSSYFLGLFFASVRTLGSADAFLDRFRFRGSDRIMRQVSHGLDRCISDMEHAAARH